MTKAPEFDPLDDVVVARGRNGVPRDQWDRPQLYPRGLEGTARVPYSSASSLSDYLANKRGLQIWRERMIARGFGMDEDLAALAGSETYTTGLGEVDAAANQVSGKRLDGYVEQAMDVARANQRRNWGTAFHAHTEPGSTNPVPKRMQADVHSFEDALRRSRISIVATELFVANDDLMTAGTFDHLVRVPGVAKLRVLDKKTGVFGPDKDEIQLASYAGGDLYSLDPEERHTYLEAFGEEVDQEWAYTAHTAAGSGHTVIYPINITRGLERGKLAAAVRDDQRAKAQAHHSPLDLDALGELAARDALLALDPPTKDGLRSIFAEFKDVWTDSLDELGRQRWKEIRS